MTPKERFAAIAKMRIRWRSLREHRPPRLEAEWATADLELLLDDDANLRSAVADLVLLCRRLVRRDDRAKRSELEKHAIRIGEKCGVPMPSVLRGQTAEEARS